MGIPREERTGKDPKEVCENLLNAIGNMESAVKALERAEHKVDKCSSCLVSGGNVIPQSDDDDITSKPIINRITRCAETTEKCARQIIEYVDLL